MAIEISLPALLVALHTAQLTTRQACAVLHEVALPTYTEGDNELLTALDFAYEVALDNELSDDVTNFIKGVPTMYDNMYNV